MRNLEFISNNNYCYYISLLSSLLNLMLYRRHVKRCLLKNRESQGIIIINSLLSLLNCSNNFCSIYLFNN